VIAKDTSSLRVDPAVMAGFAQSLSGATEFLQGRLNELNGEVGEMLAGWQGAAGGAYSAVWQCWHQGATEVQSALSILAELVGQAGVEFERNEAASAALLGAVDNG
jgi:WXG100 family type VII secretion target